MDFPNHYRTLGIKPSATEEEIRKAYQGIMKAGVHPDLGGRLEDSFPFTQAYSVLKSKRLKAEYDAQRKLLGSLCKQCEGSGMVSRQRGFTRRVEEPCKRCEGSGNA